MPEILYDTETNEVRAWNADMKVKGNPDYMPPVPFDAKAEIDDLKTRVETLEGKTAKL